ncbi:hypothetical protein LOTGIDRAFT_171766 [Lottia gigantea]|uniref:Gustatory receptor n=1 Tax=Lottia gigantea TaxID=225164 RepID=V4B5A0_LOTGI|nr:hypothetical protein LOTGIDRAFT_171766 [Lottia gigantea]ESP02691.1 hypothetical protein LOTGIDRAFT_171766 [Lottia gigantea]
MAPKIHDTSDHSFIPSNELYKHFVRILHFTCLYFPQGPGVLRHCFVIYRSQDTASLLVALGMFVYSIGYAYPATCSCYSISVHLPTLLSQLDEYRMRNGEFINIKTLRRLHIIFILSYVLGVLLVALIMSLCLLIHVVWIDISDLFYPFTTDTLTYATATFIYFFLSAYAASSIPLIQIALYISICCIVHAEIDNLSKQLMKITKDRNEQLPIAFEDVSTKQMNAIDQDVTFIPTLNTNSSTYSSNYKSIKLERTLEELRLRYEAVLDIIAKANEFLQHLFFAILASSIPVSCLILYGIITLNSNRPQMIYTGLTNIQVFNLLFLILILGTYTANKVKQPVEYAMKINNRNLSEKASSSLQLMSVRYLAPCLGFNVYGLFSLDSSTFLTVIGTLITYAVVIYQFAQSPSSSYHCLNNGTDVANVTYQINR